MKETRVTEIIQSYQKGNLKKVYEYLTQPDIVVLDNSWAGKIKKLIENKQFETAIQLIETVGYKMLNTNLNEDYE